MELLGEYGEVPQVLKDKIMEQKDIEVVRRWLKLAASVSSIEEFVDKIEG